MGNPVPGDLKNSITKKLLELGQQVYANRGYSFDPALLDFHLQEAIEGRFKEKPLLEHLALISITGRDTPLLLSERFAVDISPEAPVHIKEASLETVSLARRAATYLPSRLDRVHLRVSRLTRPSRDFPIRAELWPYYCLRLGWFYEALAWKEDMADLEPCFAFVKESGPCYRIHAVPSHSQKGSNKNTFDNGDGWCLYVRDIDDDTLLSAGYEVIVPSPLQVACH